MSSSVNCATTGFIRTAELPPRVPLCVLISLTHCIERRDTRDARDVGDTFELHAMTGRARHCFTAATIYERGTFSDAARRHVRNESGIRVAPRRTQRLLWQLDNSIAERLIARIGDGEAHAPFADIRFGYVLVSTILFQARGLSAANHSLACFISSSLMPDAMPFMRAASLRAPDLKSASCRI